jgi:Prokaryotic E2 family E
VLPPVDTRYLADRVLNYSVAPEGNMTCVVLRSFPLPSGLAGSQADLLLRLSAGYPDIPPDMWWFDPPVKRVDGRPIPATEVVEQYLGRRWQRWSRHLPAGQWKSGIDSLESFIALIKRELDRSVQVVAQ